MSRPYTVKVYGPPGTGKTHTATRWIERQVEQGASRDRIAFVSFTRAACEEARRRIGEYLGLYDYELDYCNTLHALCRRVLGISGDSWLVDGHKLREFGEKYGYDIGAKKRSSQEDMEEVKAGGQHAIYLAVWDFGRARMITEAGAAWRAFEAYDPYALDGVDIQRYPGFVDDYESWKKMNFLKDYTDLLLEAVALGRPLEASVAVIDEAQDMTPLLWAVEKVLFVATPARAIMADDDQAIYSYQGADPDLFNAQEAEQVHTLQQSRRLPLRVLEASTQLIRQNRHRADKTFLPVTAEIIEGRRTREPGPATREELEGTVRRVRHWMDLPIDNGESWFLLVRNWAHAPEVIQHVERLGVPYRVQQEKHYSPWSDKGPLRAAKAILTLSDPQGRLSWSELEILLDRTRTDTKAAPGMWKYGQKARIKELAAAHPGETLGLLDLCELGLTEWGFERIYRRDFNALSGGISDRDVNVYRKAQSKGYFGRETGLVTISSIHGVKGMEAQNVAILEASTGAPARNLNDPLRREEEVRLCYVGGTRAWQRLYLVDFRAAAFGQRYELFN